MVSLETKSDYLSNHLNEYNLVFGAIVGKLN